jgi:hypothetical protein
LADTSPARGRWAVHPVPPESRSIAELLRAGTLDAELAATIWLLVEGRVPLMIAGDGSAVGRTTLLSALLDLVPAGLRIVKLRGAAETFDWLPQASELGWPGTAHRPASGPPTRPEDTVLLAAELSDGGTEATWDEAARVVIRAASIGYGLAATIPAGSLDEVFAQLRAAPVGLVDDELSRLGVVLIVLDTDDGRRRVSAAHYVRPVARDAHGHLQRLGPAVLATWDPATDAFEQFGWGVTPELATRIGRRAGDFELEVDARRRFLEALLADPAADAVAVRAALAGYRPLAPATSAVVAGPPGAPPVAPHAPAEA